jgi:hypothetical protein
MERLSHDSRELLPPEKHHGLEPAHLTEEHWIAKAHYNYVENSRLGTARSPAVQSVDPPGPNVKVQLDPGAAARPDSQYAQNYPTDGGRDSDPHQTMRDDFHCPVHEEPAARPMASGPNQRSYPDDCRWLVDVEPVARRETLKAFPLRCQVLPNATSGKLA